MLIRLGIFILSAFTGIYLFITVFLYLFQSRYVFVPFKNIETNPSKVGLDYEDIRIISNDGTRLCGWYCPVLNIKDIHSKYVVLICHGNAGNISHCLSTLIIFHELGLDSFIFDYSGYGESEGSPSEMTTYNDALSAWNYLIIERRIPPENIIVFGRSLGGAIAAWLAKERTPHALIIESTFVSMASLFKAFFPYLFIKLILKYRYMTQEYLKEVSCPILVIHSLYDELVPFSQGQELYEKITVNKKFLEISGDHIEGFFTSGRVYSDGLRDFIFGDIH